MGRCEFQRNKINKIAEEKVEVRQEPIKRTSLMAISSQYFIVPLTCLGQPQDNKTTTQKTTSERNAKEKRIIKTKAKPRIQKKFFFNQITKRPKRLTCSSSYSSWPSSSCFFDMLMAFEFQSETFFKSFVALF